MKLFIKDFIWFYKESFKFMKGYNRAYIFFNVFPKGFWHCREMRRYRKARETMSADEVYVNMNRVL